MSRKSLVRSTGLSVYDNGVVDNIDKFIIEIDTGYNVEILSLNIILYCDIYNLIKLLK